MAMTPVNPWGKTYSPVPQGYAYQNGQWWDQRGGTPQLDPSMTAQRPGGTTDPGNATTRPWWWHAQMLPQAAQAFQSAFGTSTQMPQGYRNPGEMFQGQTPEQMYSAWGRSDPNMGPQQLRQVEQQRQQMIQQMLDYSRGGPPAGVQAPLGPSLNQAPPPPPANAPTAPRNQGGPQGAQGSIGGYPGYQSPRYQGGPQGLQGFLGALQQMLGGYPQQQQYPGYNQGVPQWLGTLMSLLGRRY